MQGRLAGERPETARSTAVAGPAQSGELDHQPSRLVGSEDWFEVDSRAVFVADARGGLLDANPAARELQRTGRFVHPFADRLAFSLHTAEEALARALALVCSGRSSREAVLLRGNDGEWRRLELHRRPAGPDPLAQPAAFVATHVAAERDWRIGPVCEAFNLTPTEREILAQLMADSAPKDIARLLGISTHTVRTHLRSIYAKTGTRGITSSLCKTIELSL